MHTHISKDLALLARGLALMDAGELARVFQKGVPTRLHGLGDAMALQDAARALCAAGGVTIEASASWTSGPAAMEVGPNITAQRARLLKLAQSSGFPDPQSVAAGAEAALVRLAQRLHGELRREASHKARQRVLGSAVRAAQRLGGALPQLARGPLVPVLDAPLALSDPTLPRARTQQIDVPVRAWLPAMLAAFAEGVEALLAEEASPTPGRPETMDALRFGVETLLELWCARHPAPPSMSNNQGRFVRFVEEAAGLAVEANGRPGRRAVAASTLRRLAQEAVRAHRARTPPVDQGGE